MSAAACTFEELARAEREVAWEAWLAGISRPTRTLLLRAGESSYRSAFVNGHCTLGAIMYDLLTSEV